MSPARAVRQPGPPAPERVVAIPCAGAALRIRLVAGERLLDAVARGFADAGFESGVAEFGPLQLGPFSYVMPAPARTPEHAAYYSDMFTPPGVTQIEEGALTFGLRDGQPFFHAHALWREADGKLAGGHILPETTRLAADAWIDAFGLDGARFEATQDSETNFKLFEPVAAPARGVAKQRALALRVRPNTPFLPTLDALAATHRLPRYTARGGVGSLIGATFLDSVVMDEIATEAFLRPTEGAPREIGLIDSSGRRHAGAISASDNPVLMTFELCLVEGT